MDSHQLLQFLERYARRWWPSAALLGAALVLLAAVMRDTSAGAGALPGAAQPVAVTATSPVEWMLTTERPGLARLRVWVASPAPTSARLAVTMSDSALPMLPLARAEASLSGLGPDGAIDLLFTPLRAGAAPYVPTTTLVVRLGLEGEAQSGVLLKSAEPGVVAFEPGYETRPLDAVWPISALAEGKSGVLGWPPFYALLAYGFLMTLLRALLVVVNAGLFR